MLPLIRMLLLLVLPAAHCASAGPLCLAAGRGTAQTPCQAPSRHPVPGQCPCMKQRQVWRSRCISEQSRHDDMFSGCLPSRVTTYTNPCCLHNPPAIWHAVQARSSSYAPEAPACACDCVIVVQPRLLKGSKGVGRQHLGPLVAVVAGTVSVSEDLAEGAEGAVLQEGRHDLHNTRPRMWGALRLLCNGSRGS